MASMRRKGMLSVVFTLAIQGSAADYDLVERGRVALPRSGAEFPIYPGTPAIVNGYAYLPRGAQGAFVVDARNVGAPILMGEIPNLRGSVVAQGETLWAADSGMLTAFDVANPLEPAAIGSRAIPGGAREFIAAGSFIYVVEDSAGLTIVDVANPRNPVLRGRCALPQTGWGKMAVSGNYAIVPDPVSGMTIVNVSNVDAPSQAGRYLSPRAFDNDRPGRAVAARGNMAFLADDYFLSAIDISDPTQPTLRWEIPSDLSGDVEVRDGRVFATRWEFGVSCYDVSGADPVWKGTYCPDFLAYSSTALTFHNGVGFLSRGNQSGGELLLFDAENGANLERTHEYPGAFPVAGASDGGEIYLVELGDESRMLRVYRTEESGGLQITGQTAAANASDFEIANSIAYLARLGTAGVDGYDLSDSATPRLIETLPISARSLALRGSALFTIRPSVLEIYEMADPQRPRIGRLVIDGNPFDLVVADGFAYVAGGSPVIVDVRNLAQPQGVSTPGLEYPSAVALRDGIAYFGTGNECGISIYNVTSPTTPRQLSRLRIGDSITKLWINGRYLYANGHRGGIHCIDVSDPARPLRVGGNSGASAVVIEENRIIAYNGGGVGIYSVAPELRVQFGARGVAVLGPAGVVGRLEDSPDLGEWFERDEISIGGAGAFSPQPIAGDGNRFWRFRAEREERVAPH